MRDKKFTIQAFGVLASQLGRRLQGNPVQCLKRGRVRVFENMTQAAKKLGLDRTCIAHTIAQSHNMRLYAGREWGYLYPDEAGRRAVGPFAGKTHTAASKAKMSLAKDAKKRAVVYTSPAGKVHMYSSVAEAVQRSGVTRIMISSALVRSAKLSLRNHGGSTWSEAT
jgi:hypothetical protein